MVLTALDPEETFDYVLEKERDLPGHLPRTVFKLKTLTAREVAKLEDGLATVRGKTGEVSIKSGSQVLEALRLGLRGWENLRDKEGNDLPFREHRPGVLHEASLDLLRPEWRRELANAITEGNSLDEEKVKNLDSPSPSCEEATSA